MTRSTEQPGPTAPEGHVSAKSRRGGARPGAGRKPGYSKATITRQHLIRQTLAFDAHVEVFSGLTPLEIMQVCAWRLLSEGKWYEAGILAGRMAPFHHHRKPVTSINIGPGSGDAPPPAPPSGGGGDPPGPDTPLPRIHAPGLTLFPEKRPSKPPPPAPEAPPPMPRVNDAHLSERRNGTEPRNLPSNAAVQVLLTPEAVTMLVPSLREELVDPRNPYAHWGDFHLMHNHLMNRRVWQHAERDRLRGERDAWLDARAKALREGTEPPPTPPAFEKKPRPSRSKQDQSERLWERWRTHPLTEQARALGMLDEYDRAYEPAVYFKSLGPLEVDQT